MKLEVPEGVYQAIREFQLARTAQYRAQRATEEAEYRRRHKISELRYARYDELFGYAKSVFEWRKVFTESDVAKDIWRLIGNRTRLPIFGAKFWRGEPAPPKDRTTWSRIVLEEWNAGSFGCPPFWYEERHKGQRSHQERICHVHELVDKLHPEFLAQLHEHLHGPEAWRFIIQELERWKPKGG